MAIIQALLAFLTRSAGRILNTAFGWATLMLFGQVPKERHIYLSIIAFGSVAWIVAVTGVLEPSVATFLVAFVTVPAWLDKRWIRLGMIAAPRRSCPPRRPHLPSRPRARRRVPWPAPVASSEPAFEPSPAPSRKTRRVPQTAAVPPSTPW